MSHYFHKSIVYYDLIFYALDNVYSDVKLASSQMCGTYIDLVRLACELLTS